jgi:hypothetical protein
LKSFITLVPGLDDDLAGVVLPADEAGTLRVDVSPAPKGPAAEASDPAIVANELLNKRGH